MKQIAANVTEQNLIIAPSVLSVAESVNLYTIKITYDSEWDDVDTKIVTFRGANGIAIALQDEGSTDGVTIPWEVLQCPGKVSVGVIGYVGSVQKLSTTGLYDRNTFCVLPASLGLKEALTPTPDVYQRLIQTINQINSTIGDLDDLNTTEKDNLVAAINEVLETAGVTEITDDTGASSTGSVPIKTINGESLLGTGDIEIRGGGVSVIIEDTTAIFSDDSGVSISNNTLIIGGE